jgi:PAS domain S-box-containing protein
MASSKVNLETEQTTAALLSEIAALRQEVGRLQQKVSELETDKADLEVLLDLHTDHSDTLADELLNRVEATLRESARQFQLIADTTPVPVVISRVSDGEIVYANHLAGPLLNLSPESLVGRNILDFYKGPQHHQDLLEMITQQGTLNNYELPLKKIDGEVIWVAASVQLLTFKNEPSLLAALYDLTERKQVVEERAHFLIMQQELKFALRIQVSLLPPTHPAWTDLDVVCYSDPARDVGGDFYTHHAFCPPGKENPDHYGLAVGDVSGKGMPAALLMAVSYASLEATIDRALRPAELLAYLDQAIAPHTQKIRQNFALCYVDITAPTLSLGEGVKGRIMRVANAGCIGPLIRRVNGEVQWVEAGGMPLGSGFGSILEYSEETLTLTPGDMVILSSDGVVEAMTSEGEIFGFDRLEQAVTRGPTHNATAMLTHLREQVAAFVAGAEAHDDITIVVMRV